MQDKKNRLLLWLSATAVLLSVIIFILRRMLDPLSHTTGMHGTGFEMNSLILWAQNGLFFIANCKLGTRRLLVFEK